MAQEKPERKSKAGRPALPEEEKKHYTQPGLSLRPDQIANLQELAETLDITSRSGVNYGKPSFRTLIAKLAEIAPAVVKAIKKIRSGSSVHTSYVIPIAPGISLTIGPPPEPEPEIVEPAPEPELEAVKEEIREHLTSPRKIIIVRAGDLLVHGSPPAPEA